MVTSTQKPTAAGESAVSSYPPDLQPIRCSLTRWAPAGELVELLGTLPEELQKLLMIRALKGATIDQRRAVGLLPGRLSVPLVMDTLGNNRHTYYSTKSIYDVEICRLIEVESCHICDQTHVTQAHLTWLTCQRFERGQLLMTTYQDALSGTSVPFFRQ